MSQISKLSKQVKSELGNYKGVSTLEGLKISESDDEYTVNIELRVFYGVNIPQLCYDIQTGLIRSLNDKFGVVIKSVNIRAIGIDES